MELLRLDSRGYAYHDTSVCNQCRQPDDVLYTCNECLGGHMLCKDCLLLQHKHLPFHFIKVRTLVNYLELDIDVFPSVGFRRRSTPKGGFAEPLCSIWALTCISDMNPRAFARAHILLCLCSLSSTRMAYTISAFVFAVVPAPQSHGFSWCALAYGQQRSPIRKP
jgi:hypothetical protein